MARTRAVLPVPGGPYRHQPRFHGMLRWTYHSFSPCQARTSWIRSLTCRGK